ncbi:MAG: hypothetical protein MRY83_04930 [Flavobacteriales bacterium]|nr:hypothetical protein [Flavobacteriales bacterium]
MAKSKLKDGFYFEVKNKNSNDGIKMMRESKKEVEIAMEMYKKVKEVTYLGQVKDNKFINN